MLTYLFIIILGSNLVIGILLGMSSIGGFLLPLIYIGFLGLPLRDSLALSFLSFAVAGVIGTYFYWKSRNMDIKLALLISIGSIPGAFIGVQLNVLIPDNVAKLVLYIFILVSGVSLLLKRNDNSIIEQNINTHKSKILEHNIYILVLGLITGTVCALTGVGGPIFLVPVLTYLGLNIRVTVGVCLFSSVFIALPSMFGYFSHSDIENITLLIVASVIGQIIGIITGTYFAKKVKSNHLRISIALITILSSTYVLMALFIESFL